MSLKTQAANAVGDVLTFLQQEQNTAKYSGRTFFSPLLSELIYFQQKTSRREDEFSIPQTWTLVLTFFSISLSLLHLLDVPSLHIHIYILFIFHSYLLYCSPQPNCNGYSVFKSHESRERNKTRTYSRAELRNNTFEGRPAAPLL